MDFEKFVDDGVAALQAEEGPQPMMANPTGATMHAATAWGSLMREIKAQVGAIPFAKLLMIGAVVWKGIKDGKSWQDILQEALAILTS